VGIVCTALVVYGWILLSRIILSWVTMAWSPPTALSPIIRIVYDVTEPVMAPFRRILPPVSGLDLSPILLFIILRILTNYICAAGV
jgi:YggT family protein